MSIKSGVQKVKIVENGPWGFFHFLGFIGAVVYFISQTNGGFWEVILSLLKAIVWPAYFVYYLLQFLGV